jgi:DNA uptake protein ComE-like DNA-binding protein
LQSSVGDFVTEKKSLIRPEKSLVSREIGKHIDKPWGLAYTTGGKDSDCSDRTGEDRMKHVWMAGLAFISAVAVSGCVSDKKYQAVLADADAARSDLERARAQKNALEQQVKTLKDLNAKFGSESQIARDELQRIQHGRDKERDTIDLRTKELEDRVKQLTAQNRNLKQEYEEARRHNEQLKSLVARYQKEMKERSRSLSPDMGSSMPPPSGSSSSSSKSASPPSMFGGPVERPPAPAVLNINKAPSTELVLSLGVTQDVADRIVSNRPYKVKGELVAKNVVPKDVFDDIKDRITVTP